MTAHPPTTTHVQFIVIKVTGYSGGKNNRMDVPNKNKQENIPHMLEYGPNDISVAGNLFHANTSLKKIGSPYDT